MTNVKLILIVCFVSLCLQINVAVTHTGNLTLFALDSTSSSRVATNLENLEYSGISLNMENSGNSVQPQGKIVTNKVFLVGHLNICVKHLLTW